jgi:hypothetical protein
MICSGLCLRRFIAVKSSLPHDGVSDSHNGLDQFTGTRSVGSSCPSLLRTYVWWRLSQISKVS